MPDPIPTSVPVPASSLESPTTGVVGVPPSSAAPVPTAPAAPAAPAASVVPDTSQDETVPLRPETVVNVRDANGRLIPTQLGTMAQAFLDQQTVGATVAPEDVEKFKLYQKAVKDNDPQAMLALVQPTTPKPSDVTPSDSRFDEMQATVTKIQQQLEASTAITGRITQEAESSQVRQFIASNAASYPFLSHAVAKQPGYADSVRVARQSILVEAERQVVAQGGDWAAWKANVKDIHTNSLLLAMNQVEASVKQFAGVFGVNATSPQTAPVVINDQKATGAPGQTSDHAPPRFAFNKGTGQFERPGDPSVTNGQPLPTQPVIPGVGGAPMVPTTVAKGPINLDAFQQGLRGQTQALTQVV